MDQSKDINSGNLPDYVSIDDTGELVLVFDELTEADIDAVMAFDEATGCEVLSPRRLKYVQKKMFSSERFSTYLKLSRDILTEMGLDFNEYRGLH